MNECSCDKKGFISLKIHSDSYKNSDKKKNVNGS